MVSVDPNCIFSPMAGRAVPLTEVPDPIFSGGILGRGIAIIPSDGRVYAPCDATVDAILETGHAISLLADNGAELLIHVGIGTVGMEGKCFRIHIRNGQKVKRGQLLLEADLEMIRAAALNPITPVLVCNADDYPGFGVCTDSAVTAQTVILTLTK